jgi:prophage regulatory protein
MANARLPETVNLIRLPEVRKRTGKAKSTIYQEIKDGNFPRPRRIGKRAVAWREDEINSFNASRPAA